MTQKWQQRQPGSNWGEFDPADQLDRLANPIGTVWVYSPTR